MMIQPPIPIEKGTKEYQATLDKCPICLCALGKKCYISSCNHRFHYKCIIKWILQSNNCPMCRTQIRGDEDDDDDEPIPFLTGTDEDVHRQILSFFFRRNFFFRIYT